ncbi:MAG: YihY/virulence factor BrkB family protein [Spirochaetales bacterium]|nr:YihY/virulence factor BrkB family protein [Spirochaetales bacterium]
MWSFIEQFNEDSASMLSNGMVYSTLIAIIPCFAVIYAILNALGALEPVVDLIENTIMSTFGQGTGDTLVGYLRIFTENAMGMGVVSILSFGLTFVLLIDKIFTVINKIYHTPKKGKIVTRYLKYIGIIIIGILSIALMVYLVGRFNSVSVRMRKLPELSGLQKVFKTLIPIALIFGLMLAMICLIPNCKVRFLSGLIGAIVGTVGIYGLVKVFQFVVSWSVKYSVIYGSLATLLFFFMFLSYLWKIIFAAVIVSYVHQTQTTGIEYEL